LIQDFTDKLDLLDKSVDKVNKTGSQTALYDAVWQFSDEKMRNAPGRRVIVVITDGEDTFSRAELKDAIDIAQRTETTIFAISTKAGFLGSVPGVEAGTVKDKGDKYLAQFAKPPAAKYFSPAICSNSNARSRKFLRNCARNTSSLIVRRIKTTTAESAKSKFV
jgi:hypothetical protein